MSVLVVGDIVTDVLAVLDGPVAAGSDTPAGIRLTGGGAGANTAAWLATAGVAVTLAGVVGADAAGDARLAELAAAGVRLAVRRSPDAPTGTVVVLAEPAERTMLQDRGANLLLAPSDVEAALSGVDGHLHLSGYTLLDERSRAAGRRALALAREQGMTISVDAASAAPLRRVGGPAFLSCVPEIDLLLANAGEARALLDAGDDVPPDRLAAALAESVGAAVVKCGAAGAVWAQRGARPVTVAAEPVTVVDPTGAGDAFAAGLLSAWLAGAGPAAALRCGAQFGARAVATPGARPPLVR